MKNLFALIAFLTPYLLTYANPITPNEALSRLKISGKQIPSYGVDSNSPRLIFSGKTSDGLPAYYIFTNDAGTLFLSADDKAEALLGYTDKGNFDINNLSPSLKWWFGEYTREIEWLRGNEESDIKLTSSAANKAVSEPKAPIAPMIATKWNQGNPFNLLCPMKSGERTVTGCVATAMAQVLNYYKWPVEKVDPISYDWNGQTLTSPATVIEWDKMLDSYNDSYTDAEAMAVARLMQIAGYSVNMNYGLSSEGGSGAPSSNLRNVFVDIFGYDEASNFVYRNFYDARQWENTIYENLLNVGPLFYDGTGTNGGHAFVCDGYDGNGYFHFNWGWGGLEDGYFLLSALNPGQLGIGGGAGGFNYDQGALLGARRPVAGSVAPTPFLACSGTMTAITDGNKLTITTEEDNQGFFNYGFYQATFKISLELQNIESGEKILLPDFSANIQPNYGYKSLIFYLRNIPDGNYDVTPIFSVDGGDWESFRFYNGTPDHLEIQFYNGNITLINKDVITVESIDIITPFTTGGPYEFEANISNSNYVDVTADIIAFICIESSNGYSIVERLDTASATIPGEGSDNISFKGTLSDEVDEGDYYLILTDPDLTILYIEEVKVSSDQGGVSPTQYSLDPDPIRSGEVSNVTTVFENTASESHYMESSLYLCSYDDNTFYIAAEYGTEQFIISGNSTASVVYTTQLPQLPADVYYLVWANSDNEIIGYVQVEVDFSTLSITPSAEQEEMRLFTLQGVEVDSKNPAPGIYISIQGKQTQKIVIK